MKLLLSLVNALASMAMAGISTLGYALSADGEPAWSHHLVFYVVVAISILGFSILEKLHDE